MHAHFLGLREKLMWKLKLPTKFLVSLDAPVKLVRKRLALQKRSEKIGTFNASICHKMVLFLLTNLVMYETLQQS